MTDEQEEERRDPDAGSAFARVRELHADRARRRACSREPRHLFGGAPAPGCSSSSARDHTHLVSSTAPIWRSPTSSSACTGSGMGGSGPAWRMRAWRTSSGSRARDPDCSTSSCRRPTENRDSRQSSKRSRRRDQRVLPDVPFVARARTPRSRRPRRAAERAIRRGIRARQ